MRRSTLVLVLISLGLGASACSGDEGSGPLAATARWRLRCPMDGAGCFDSERPARSISAREGDPDAVVSCAFTDVDTNLRVLTIELESANASLLVENVRVNDAGGIVAGDGCEVTIEDEGVFFGPHHCGPAAPSVDQPCQITTVVFDESGSLTLDDGTVEGKLLSTTVRCETITDQSVTETRHLVSPDSPPPNFMPAPISVVNCDGF